MRGVLLLALLAAARLAAGACLDDCRAAWGGSGPDYDECVVDCGVCGNGDVEGDEACDDGNTAAGDCCDAACRAEPAGSPCRDDGAPSNEDLCSTPVCDGTGDCERQDVPAPDCRWPVDAGASTLAIRDAADDTKDLLVWRWRRGAATAKAELGDPTADTGYALCLYDRTGLVASLALPAGGTCGARDCWRETPGGFRYRSATGEPDGAVSALMKQGRRRGQAKVSLEAEGENLDLPDLAALESPLTVQLRRGGSPTCWTAQYTASPARRHGEWQLRDRSDPPPAPTTSTTATTTTTSTAPAGTSTTTTTVGTTLPRAVVEVAVVDVGGAPVPDADVTVTYGGAAPDAFDVSDAAGMAVFAGEPVGVPATIAAEDGDGRTGSASSPGFAAGTNQVTVTVR